MLTRKAYAKVNLGLDVLRKREDGYHELRMIMQTVDLYDILTFEKKKSGITVTTDREELPGDESNLIYQAARLLMDTCRMEEGVSIGLTKKIPMAAGMAGGSADAAAVFHGMNELFSLGLSEERMCGLGVKLGADVPYCIMGGTVLAQGIGEILKRLPDMPHCHLLLAKPEAGVSSGHVYGKLKADRLPYHPDIDGMMDAVRAGDLTGITRRMGNVLETVTAVEYPAIEHIKERMREYGALEALMSGSGPTVFGVFETGEKAVNACEQLKRDALAKQLYVTEPIGAATIRERNEAGYE